ncbi:unnamed protein product [Spirodela intermedia]|uniref:Protein kinase domain-containing protein n=1 Tax=Spirodela intermedia TaxID=51605 RepID=A0A7I8IY85_SPIIN|nr:unnamed protein product [Spirodela intermedia]CAA6662828.1 unnamed protein product [Spirodela intermedia]
MLNITITEVNNPMSASSTALLHIKNFPTYYVFILSKVRVIGDWGDGKRHNAGRSRALHKVLPNETTAIYILERAEQIDSNLRDEEVRGRSYDLVIRVTLTGLDLSVSPSLLRPDAEGVKTEKRELRGAAGLQLGENNRILLYQLGGGKGSLRDLLHGLSLAPLSWSQRSKIVNGEGMEFLHERVQPPLVHRDMRSSNVLLFDDFGSPDTAAPLHSTRVFGIFGYHASSEVSHPRQSTQKIDVHTFSVVFLELRTGRKPWTTPCPKAFRVRRFPQCMAAVAVLCGQHEADFQPHMTVVVKPSHPLPNSRVEQGNHI